MQDADRIHRINTDVNSGTEEQTAQVSAPMAAAMKQRFFTSGTNY